MIKTYFCVRQTQLLAKKTKKNEFVTLRKLLKNFCYCFNFFLIRLCPLFRGLMLCAKCRVAASAALPEVERRTELLEGARLLDKAKEGFLQLQDWDR